MLFRGRRVNKQTSSDHTFPEPRMASTVVGSTSLVEPTAIKTGGLLPEDTTRVRHENEAFLVELDAAISSGKVNLGHIVLARYLSLKTPPLGVTEGANSTADRFEILQNIYFQNWTIVDRHYCTNIPAAVSLKKSSSEQRQLEIEFVYFPDATKTTSPEIEAAVWKARSYYLDADQSESARHDLIVRDIFVLIAYLLDLADAEAMSGYDRKRTEHALPKVSDDLRQIAIKIERALSIEARHYYLAGMFIGIVVLLIGVQAINLITKHFTSVHIDTLGLGAVVAGGVGAVLSVMTRLTANNLRVDPTVGRPLVLVAGGFRPLIGGIFAFAIYIFVRGGLLPIRVTVTGLKETYFFLGIAFLAGFSERLAQDAVTRAGSVISDTGPLAKSDNE